jgi:plasmid maintenance system antidote protein VapI
MDFMALLSELRDAIKRDERPHAAIAREAGIHPKTFSAFVNGHRGLSVETTESLAKSLGFEIKLVRLKR